MSQDRQKVNTSSDIAEARRKLATQKFDILSTVAGDPECQPVDVSIILHLNNFRNEANPNPYCSNADLCILSSVKSENTIRAGLKRLKRRGYLTVVGKTAAGIPRFKIANPHSAEIRALTNELRRARSEPSQSSVPSKNEGIAPKNGNGETSNNEGLGVQNLRTSTVHSTLIKGGLKPPHLDQPKTIIVVAREAEQADDDTPADRLDNLAADNSSVACPPLGAAIAGMNIKREQSNLNAPFGKRVSSSPSAVRSRNADQVYQTSAIRALSVSAANRHGRGRDVQLPFDFMSAGQKSASSVEVN